MSNNQSLISVVSSLSPRISAVKNQTYLRPSLYYCMMADHAAKQDVRFMLFSPQGADFSLQTVDAWVPVNPMRPFENWRKQKMPLPDSIYENVFVHLAIRGYSVPLRKMAMRRHIPVFNPSLPGKWLMAKWLMNSSLAKYQPETFLLPAPKTALSHIRNWGTAYVKPVGGYGGMGVSRVETLPGQRYRVSVDRQNSKGKKVRMVFSETELSNWLFKKQKIPHLLQRGLDLCTVNQRKIDFRVVTQRDIDGKWNIVGIIPKLAAKDGVVTNIIAGGEVLDLTNLNQMAESAGWKVPTSKISACALDISKLIARKAPNVGLLGFDIGVEKNDRVSMIEMNPKPARSLLTKKMRAEAAKYASEFSIYLARK